MGNPGPPVRVDPPSSCRRPRARPIERINARRTRGVARRRSSCRASTSSRPATASPRPRRISRTSRSSGRWCRAPARMARHPELEVAFSTDKPSLVTGPEGAKARLPGAAAQGQPARGGDPPRARQFLRAEARLPQRRDPPPPRAAKPGGAALFDAVEQARVEAIGARRMEGVASNLTAMLDDRYHRSPFAEARTPRGGAARGRRRHAGARAPDRPEAAARRAAPHRTLARLHRGEGGRRPRPAGRRPPRPARLRQARAEAS